jgi:drug/metabolite transporter (DMT)-like permease
MKIGLSEIPPWVFRAAANMSGAAGLFLIARLNGLSLRVPQNQIKGLVVASLLNMTIWNIFVFYGVALMNSGRAAILAYTMPLWATLIGTLVLKERLSARAIIALLFGFLGMALLFFGADGALQSPSLGPVLVVIAAISWGAGTVAIKYYRFTMPVTVLTAWQHLIGGLPVLLIALIWDVRNIDHPSLLPVLCVVYNMTVTAIFCYWAYFKVVSSLPVVISTVGTLMVPVLGVFFTALIFREPPTWIDYTALAAVAGAVFLVLTKKS